MKERLRRVLKKAAAPALFGILYAFWVDRTGIGIPCLFHLVTGLKCPGCGVTRMLISLFRLDPAAAFRSNAVLLCLAPLLAALGALSLVRYVRTGERALPRRENTLIVAAAVILLVWGVVRNLPWIPEL